MSRLAENLRFLRAHYGLVGHQVEAPVLEERDDQSEEDSNKAARKALGEYLE